jgi:hypothetical protein
VGPDADTLLAGTGPGRAGRPVEIATLGAMRTRGAVEDLVVVDLDDPDEVQGRGPVAQRRHFEDHYAELPFGLGTVPRRLEHDPWYTRSGVLLWIAIALIGLVALAGSGDGGKEATQPLGSVPVYPVLERKTGARLLFTHVERYSLFDVDAGTFQEVAPSLLEAPPAPPAIQLESGPPDAQGRRALIARGPAGPSVVTNDGYALANNSTTIVWRPNRCRVCAIRLTDERTGRTRTLAHTSEGGPRSIVLAPNGSAVGLLDYDGPSHWRLRLIRASGPVAANLDLTGDVVTTVWSLDSRWLFVVSGATMLAIDRASGEPARIGNTLPPFEGLTAYGGSAPSEPPSSALVP